MHYNSRKKQRSFYCPNPLCILEFSNENDINSHVATDDHQYATAKTTLDKAILYYASQKYIQNASSHVAPSNEMDIDDDFNDSNYSKIYVKGWARKVRTVTKITPKQKEFIQKLFETGAKNKAKLSAEQMTEETVDGNYYFSPAQYLDPKRIRSLITSF